jgi:hypothetical protein
MTSTKKVNPKLEAISKSIVVPTGSANELNLERSIDLDPEDWYWATWRNLPPLPRPEPKPFNLQDCLKRLRKVTQYWDWRKVKVDDILSRAEAHFWFVAKLEAAIEMNQRYFFNPSCLADRLSTQIFDGNLLDKDIDNFCAILNHNPHGYSTEAMLLLNLLDLEPLINVADKIAQKTPIVHGFRSIIRWNLQPIQITELKKVLRLRLEQSNWNAMGLDRPLEFFLAAQIGMHDELLALVKSWDDDTFCKNRSHSVYYQKPQEIVFGLKDSNLVRYHFKRLDLNLQTPDYILQGSAYIRAWLAHTEYSDLDMIRDVILKAGQKRNAAEMLKAFALVKAPEAAPFMLELMLASKAPQVAKQWLEDNPAHAIAGLIPVARDEGKYKEAAIEFLRSMKLKGYGEYVRACCDKESPEIAHRLNSTILDFGVKEYIKFDDETTPEWLSQSIATVEKPEKKPKWKVLTSNLPPIVCGNYCLNDKQVEILLNALRQSELERPQHLVIAIKKHANPIELESFVWQLFTAWLTNGAISKESWAMKAVGLLGNDDSALKLVPLIKIWPRQTQHARTKLGHECLQAIGVTMAQCEDRLIPHCNLDERGTRIFDFGDRQFWLVVSDGLKPMLKDAAHKLYPNLPKPNRKDDKEKAEAAIVEWKVLKQQVTDVFKIQSSRLEGAMTSKRRWEVTEFETLLVRHPLMCYLTQLIVWGGYDKEGHLIGTFHVTEDRTYADEKDITCVLDTFDRVGIVHPDEFSPELLTTWGELMSDYKIVSPFVQLVRSIGDRESQEEINT